MKEVFFGGVFLLLSCSGADKDTVEPTDSGDATDKADTAEESDPADVDGDGYSEAVDCDDHDASSTVVAEDGDCDGVLTSDDCDDSDASSTVVAEDGDCDGVLTEDDCDDSDAASTVVAEDEDCDGVLTSDDCDDSDSTTLECMSCWVIAGPHTNTYCYEPIEVWPSPGFRAQCENGSDYLSWSEDLCLDTHVIGYCHLPSDAGGDYLGAAIGYYYEGGSTSPTPETGCRTANGTYEAAR